MPNRLSFFQFSTFWRWNLGVWAVAAVPLFLVRYSMHGNAFHALGLTVFQEILSILLCWQLRNAYRYYLRRWGSFGIPMAASLIFLSLVATGVQAMAVLLLVHFTGWRNPLWSPLEEWLLRLMFYWLIYMTCSLLYFWLHAEQEARELSELAAEAKANAQRMELELLRAQLDPHFLFNSLNGVATVIPSNPEMAVSMVHELSDYLRYSLENRDRAIIPLAAEIDAMKAYLKIEQARFGAQMTMDVTADDTARQRRIPCFLLQPLVENAVKHGLQSADPPWHIQIQAKATGTTLVLSVINSGRYTPNPASPGIGLPILRRRLQLHYPRRHQLKLNQDNQGVRAELTLEGEP